MHYFQNATFHSRYPSHRRKPPPWRIALLANLVDEFMPLPGAPADAGAEFDKRETVEAIAGALEADGHWVHICSADSTLTETLPNLRPDICFNIAEGLYGDAREAQVPALCEMLGIPYTASRVLANALSLDKAQTKRIWQSFGLPTARYQEFQFPDQPIDAGLSFPMLVKPVREGTGMGIDEGALVETEAHLRERLAAVIHSYQQPALAEEYLPGREFTVGFIGNPGSPLNRRRPELYDLDGYHFFPVLELDNQQSSTPGVYGYAAKAKPIGAPGAPEYLCPADIPISLREELWRLARQAAEAIGTCDVARVDIRLDAEGTPCLLEINTLPGLNPAVSDLCIIAAAEGMPYATLITEILYLAADRFRLPHRSERDAVAIALEPALSTGLEIGPRNGRTVSGGDSHFRGRHGR